MFNQLHIFASQAETKKYVATQASIEIKEVTKLAEKLKWNERFIKSYSGGLQSITTESLGGCKMFLASLNEKEAGYIRISDYTKRFSKFYDGEVFSICEGYVKPTYRNNGVLTALRAHVVNNHNVKLMRIETERYFRLKNYYKEQGFMYGYPIEDGELSVICVPEFYNALIEFDKWNSKH